MSGTRMATWQGGPHHGERIEVDWLTAVYVDDPGDVPPVEYLPGSPEPVVQPPRMRACPVRMGVDGELYVVWGAP